MASTITAVAARAGMRKTAFAMTVVINVARSFPEQRVVLFTREEPRQRFVSLMLAAEARVNIGRVRTGALSPADWQRLTTMGPS